MKKPLKIKICELISRLGIRPPKYMILEYAKYLYQSLSLPGMCLSIKYALVKLHIKETDPNKLFSKFNQEFCGAVKLVYWWDIKDRESRINAFLSSFSFKIIAIVVFPTP